jgi:hypothetical protein
MSTVVRRLAAACALAVAMPLVPATAATAQPGFAGGGSPPVTDPPAELADAVDRALPGDGIPQAKVTASDGASGDRLGRSVAVSEDGNTAVAGALLATVDGDPFRGAAYVFTRDGTGGWSQRQKLVSSDGSDGDRFGGAAAIDGDTMVIGAWGWTAQTGAAYVFVRDGDGWVEQTRLTAPDGRTGDAFGEYVAVDGDTVLVGASLADGEGTNFEQGAAYVFTRSGTSWGAPVKLTDPDGERNDQFGHGVALAGDTALVGAPFGKVGDNFLQGAVHEFTRADDGWPQTGRLTVSDGVGLDRFGFSVSLAGDGGTALVGAIGVEVAGNAGAGAAYVLTRGTGGWTEPARLTASDGAAFDNFGASVALAGDRALVGADFATVDGQSLQGAAYLYTGAGADWQEQAKLVAADGAEFDSFGRPVALAGDLAMVGVPLADVGGTGEQGAAYLFDLSGGGGPIPAGTILAASDGAADDWFGRSVAVDGDTVVVGADAADVGGTFNQGAAYVFVRDGDSWVEQARLTASDGGSSDQFGFSVAIAGDTALIGSADDAAYVFTRDGGTWTEQAKLVPGDGTEFDRFGIAVALSGNGGTALVGARQSVVAGRNNQGAAYVFTRDGDTWTERAKLTASDGAAFDLLGDAVALSDGGDTAVVGAEFHDPDGNDAQGAAYVFTRDGEAWTQQGKLTAAAGVSGDRFGDSVAVSGDTVLVGAGFPNAIRGAAYVFTRAAPERSREAGDAAGITAEGWTEQATLTASDASANAWFGNSVALAGDTALVGAWFADGQGAAYQFGRDGETWAEQLKLTAAERGPNDQYGSAVALAGDGTAVVGAWLTDPDGVRDQGVAHAYQLDVPEPAPPVVGVDPVALSVTLDAGETASEPVTIGNLGEAVLAWTVSAAPGCGTPGEVPWLGVAPAGGRTAGGATSEVTATLDASVVGAGEYEAALCIESNDPATPLVEVPVSLAVTGRVCDETITGVHAGALAVSEGVTCLAAGAQVRGEVNVSAGAGLIATAAVIQGPVSAVGASTVELVFSQVTGPVLVTGAERVSLFASQVTGSVTLLSNVTADPATVSGNTIIGSLSCLGNQPPPIDHGLPNTATGGKLGQCADL